MVRVKDKGELYYHQDANWNVVAMTDLAGQVMERYEYSPYGEMVVNQENSWANRDGDEDIDSSDKGTPGTTCSGPLTTGSCKIMDLDYDGDYDNVDGTKFDSLPQGLARHPSRLSSNLSQSFGHQGLFFDPEISSYQNRARQYDPAKRRFLQRDPLGYVDGINTYAYLGCSPTSSSDPLGTSIVTWAMRTIIQIPIAVTEGIVGLLMCRDFVESVENYGEYCGRRNGCSGHYDPPIYYDRSYWCFSGPMGHVYPTDVPCPDPEDDLDDCCMRHDACYGGGDPGEVYFRCTDRTIPLNPIYYDPFGVSQECDSELCNCMDELSLVPFSDAWIQREQMRVVFFCDVIV